VTLFDGLHSGWIEKGLLKRKSNYSPVVCYETTDPRRLYQLKRFLLESPEFREFKNLFVYDRWDGLGRLARGAWGEPEVEPYKKSAAGSPLARRVGQGAGVELTQLKSALKEVDPFLRREPTAFVIQNISENREWESGLQSALRSWAIDSSIITRKSVVFVVTADAAAILDDFTRELLVVITVDPSSREERRSVIDGVASELGLSPGSERVAELVVATAGLNLHQLESVLLESYHRERRFEVATVKDLKSELVKKSGILEVKDPTYSFDDIGGYEVIKEFVRKYVVNVLKRPEKATRFGLTLPKGLLFFGPPGTGKSLFANALASEVQLPFINLVTENIYSKWLGESGQKMKNAIMLAEKMSPAIVFVDEIDRFGRRGGGAADSAGEETRRVFSQFLEWLGDPGRSAIIVGTTNVPEHLDEAFTRTGRLDYKIPFLYPGEAARLDILMVHLGLRKGSCRPRAPMSVTADEMKRFLREEIVPRTGRFSCAELEELVVRAKRVAFDRDADALAPGDFVAAAESFRIDEETRLDIVESCVEQAKRFTDDATFLEDVRRETDAEYRQARNVGGS